MIPTESETEDEKCPDCGVTPGTAHEDGCDVALCLDTGYQRLSCDYAEYDPDEDHDCGQDVWTGKWPGEAECEQFGWYCYWPPDAGEPRGKWQRISVHQVQAWKALHPDVDVMLDLNRLQMEAKWDKALGRWVLP